MNTGLIVKGKKATTQTSDPFADQDMNMNDEIATMDKNGKIKLVG